LAAAAVASLPGTAEEVVLAFYQQQQVHSVSSSLRISMVHCRVTWLETPTSVISLRKTYQGCW